MRVLIIEDQVLLRDGLTRMLTAYGMDVLQMLELHVADWHRHPVKAKAEEGGTKHRLRPDPVRGYRPAIGAWTPTAVRDALDNPMYTGYMV